MKWPKILLNTLWKTIKELVKKFVGKDGSALIKLITDEIAILEDSKLSGDKKRKAVQRKARAWLKERGAVMSETLLNVLIEIAVARLTK